jgi:hypothetical protein
MRPFLIGLALLGAPGLAFTACSQDPTSSTMSTSGTGGAPNCEGVYLAIGHDGGNPCNICLHDNCCAELAVCRDDACIECANFSALPGCSPESKAAEHCANTRCLSICSPGWDPSTSSSTTSTTSGG